MAVRIVLDSPHNHFTNLDYITGRVLLQLSVNETISTIIVKLEGESKSRLAHPDVYPDRPREHHELEVHKLLYKTTEVFPTQPLANAVTPGASYTLPPGQHEYPFQFKIPFNNNCSNSNSAATNFNLVGLRLERAKDTNKHVKKTLPPSLTGFPGQAEIRYFVKVTVHRPAFFKENFRAQKDFKFLPIEPPRPPKTPRQSYGRRQHQFAPAINPPDKPSLFRKQSITTKAEGDSTPPSISFEGRLPEPPIITCNEPLPLKILVTKLNDSPATIYLQLIELVLVSNTLTRAHELRRDEPGSFVLISRSNLHIPLRPLTGKQDSKEMEIDRALWNQAPLPNTVAPTFDTCNISRTYFLDTKIGLAWGAGTGKQINPELMVQTIRMSVQVYSGITPPEELLAAMANNPSAFEARPPPLPQRPSFLQQQTAPQFAPAPPDIPEEAPPSYEDAMADSLDPIDGPRRDYAPSQQQTVPTVSDEKAGLGERSFPGSGR